MLSGSRRALPGASLTSYETTHMKLYDFDPAANGQRVRVFLAEKGLTLTSVQLNVREGQQYQEPFVSLNPFNCVPFLELDDGTVISESVSICRYLEELHPEPSLFGRTPVERATIDMWNRRLELDGFIPILHAVRNHLPNFKGRVVPGTRNDLPQVPALVERGKEMTGILLDRIDPHLAKHAFIAGAAFSIADITGFFMMNMATKLEMDIKGRHPNVHRWHQALAARPSMQF
jgi:glutathione S-transferase